MGYYQSSVKKRIQEKIPDLMFFAAVSHTVDMLWLEKKSIGNEC